MVTYRYRAFISYAHGDQAWANWLQESLEKYRVPSRLGLDERRLGTIFVDHSELGTSADLSESIHDALDASEYLIVLCSPAAAASKWVNEEIRYFRSRHASNRILCVLVSGVPDRDDPDCAFPATLLFDDQGEPLHDPLAATPGDSRDQKRSALLRVIAGLLSVNYDDLVRRDVQRQVRVRTAIAAFSLVLAMVTGSLAVTTSIALDEADARRAQAERLINFMLVDLRDRLVPLGKLELLDAVGDEAMQYFATYSAQGNEQEILAQAMALRQIGEVRFRQGKLAQADEAFVASRNVAQALFNQFPDSNEYLFELGQAEFWVGYTRYEQHGLEQAEPLIQKYLDYSRMLVDREPGNIDYQLEYIFGQSNLGSMKFQAGQYERALQSYLDGWTAMEALTRQNPDNLDFSQHLANINSWIGAIHLQLGALEDSRKAYAQTVEALRLLHQRSGNRLNSEYFAQNLGHLGNVLLHQGKLPGATVQFRQARTVLQDLVSHDPENSIWRTDLGIAEVNLAEALYLQNDMAEARKYLQSAIDQFMTLRSAGNADVRGLAGLSMAEAMLGQIDGQPHLVAAAYQRMQQLIEDGESKSMVLGTLGKTGLALGRLKDKSEEAEILQASLAALELEAHPGFVNQLIGQRIARQLGIETISNDLIPAGFNDPWESGFVATSAE